ncbi:MAG: hypothetical protein MO852_17715, partial [Candidatus Devosia euplotis]|nr:hypothetical protein [Candidatus Devosia euplotis]
MLNGDVGSIYETERALLAGVEVDAESVFDAAMTLHGLDGGSPTGFQPPMQEGDFRITERGRIESSLVPAEVKSTALVKVETSVALATRRSNVVNVLQQSVAASTAVAKMEGALTAMDPTTPEFVEALDVYHAFSTALQFHSHKVWQHSGTIDRLAAGVVENGNTRHRHAMLDYLYGDSEKLRQTMRTTKPYHRDTNVRDVTLALHRLILALPTLDEAALDFIFDNVDRLKTIDDADQLSAEDATSWYAEIQSYRRAAPLDERPVLAAMKNEEPTTAMLGKYRVKVCTRETAADGTPGPVLEVSKVESTIKEDSEDFVMIDRLRSI